MTAKPRSVSISVQVFRGDIEEKCTKYWSRRRLADLPPQSAVVAGVARQNPLHQRRPRAHHADHHQGPLDALVGDLRVAGEPVHRAQAGDEATVKLPPLDGRPDRVEGRVRQGLEQHVERCSERVIAELRQTGRLTGVGEKGRLVEGLRGNARHDRLLFAACRIP